MNEGLDAEWEAECNRRRARNKCDKCDGETPYLCECAKKQFIANRNKKAKLTERELTDTEAEERWESMRGIICSFSMEKCKVCNDGYMTDNCNCTKANWIAWIKKNETK